MADPKLSNAAAHPDILINEAYRPNTATSFLFCSIVGVIGTMITMLLFYPMKDTAMNYPYEVVWERGPIQWIELWMGFTVVGHLIQKNRILRRQREPLLENPVDPNIDLGHDQEVSDLRMKLRANPNFTQSILLGRVDRTLAQWLGTRDVGLVASWASSDSNREIDSSGSTHVIAQVLMGMIPMMGFIGTVLGLGMAVSGFSNFLSGEVEMSAIKDALRNVTASLGTAFDTTLLALLLVVAITIPLSTAIRRENEMLSAFETFMDDQVISQLPPQETTTIRIENLEDSIDAAFRRYIPDPDRYDEVFSRAIDKAADAVQEKFGVLTSSYEAALGEMAVRLAGSLTIAGESVESSLRAVVQDVHSQDAQMVESRKGIAREESERLRVMLESFKASTDLATRQTLDQMAKVESSTSAGFERTVDAAGALAERLAEIRGLASKIDELLRVEQAVAEGLRGVSDSEDFRGTLAQLRQHLASTDAFCRQLARPRVITLREASLS
jgi:hypothetical protein